MNHKRFHVVGSELGMGKDPVWSGRRSKLLLSMEITLYKTYRHFLTFVEDF